MPRFRYVGPLDGIDIPLLRLVEVKRGDELDATDAQAELLGAQPDNYEPVDKAAKAIAERVCAEHDAAYALLVPQSAADEPADPDPEPATDPAPAEPTDPAQEG